MKKLNLLLLFFLGFSPIAIAMQEADSHNYSRCIGQTGGVLGNWIVCGSDENYKSFAGFCIVMQSLAPIFCGFPLLGVGASQLASAVINPCTIAETVIGCVSSLPCVCGTTGIVIENCAHGLKNDEMIIGVEQGKKCFREKVLDANCCPYEFH